MSALSRSHQDAPGRWCKYLAVALICQGGAALLLPGAARKPQVQPAPLEVELIVPVHSRTQSQVAALERPARPGLNQADRPLQKEAQPAPAEENPAGLQREVAPRLPAPEPVRQQEPSPLPAPVPTPVPAAPASLPRNVRAALVPAAPRSASIEPAHLPAIQSRQEGGGRPREGEGGAAGKAAARLGDYLAVVRSMVENNREYPATARQLGLQGTVTVRLSIRGDGSIGEMAIRQSAGHKSMDKAAISAVRRAAPFRTPGGFGLGEVTVEIPIVYRLT